ncbi:hypothetical protein LNI90_11575 [Tenacibaculum dicentrarchi]|nr:hypothetical protein [Tenacibaculum dicentrarchi]
MKKKIIFGIFAFFFGIGIALYSDSYFRELIQNIFKLSTSGKIEFRGKDFYILLNEFYYYTFGIGFLTLTVENLNKKLTQVLKSGIISLLIFGLILIGISSIVANMKIIECTACENGIRKLHWNDINYGLIVGLSILISIVPNLIRIIKIWKKPAHNTV